MSYSEKIKRRINALKISFDIYREIKHKPRYIDWYLNEMPKMKKFTNIHYGEDCFIICNGPSLNKTDLDKLKGCYVFGLNKIHLIKEKFDIDFSYMVAVNPLVIEQTKDIYAQMTIPVFLSSKVELKPNPNFYFLGDYGEFDFSTDLNKGISEGYTVTYAALQLAFVMGFSRVFIVGADHYFKQIGMPNSEEVLENDDINHFHPDYFKGQRWHLADIEGNEISYRIAKRKFNAYGRKIYNATVGGYLDIFERIDFNEAVKICKKK